jgi:hypothetical protein
MDSYTPEKSQVITKIKGQHVEQRLKFVNRKGVFKYREQCDNCKFRGKVQVGLGFAFDFSCDREEGFWKQKSGTTTKECEFFKPKG